VCFIGKVKRFLRAIGVIRRTNRPLSYWYCVR
jgi:hypothetical protein